MACLSVVVIACMIIASYWPITTKYCLQIALFAGVYLLSESINLGKRIKVVEHLMKVLKNAIWQDYGKKD